MKNPEDLKILVVGDIMLDKYIVGNVERISAEAPVPIVHVKDEYSTLGGCGNVVRNLVEIGANVTCLASVAVDADGEKIKDELDRNNVRNLIIYASKETTVKERIIADERKIQMLRIDKENISPVKPEYAISILKQHTKDNFDMIIVSDYAKGMITRELMDYLKTHHNAPIIVDPKPIHGYMYNDVFMITPNEKEWGIMQISSQYLLKGVPYTLVTKGRSGMTLYDSSGSCDILAEPVEVYNVSGAGDTVIAVMGVCLAMSFSPIDAAKIANKCAGYVVTQSGTSVVRRDIFMAHTF
jgi:rfaE bifunctional protein kinase chain/domain